MLWCRTGTAAHLRQHPWQAGEADREVVVNIPHCPTHPLLLVLLLVENLTMAFTEVLVTPVQCFLPYRLRLGLLVGLIWGPK